MAAGLLALAGYLPAPFVAARGAHAHPGSGGGLRLAAAFGAFSKHEAYLRVTEHGTSWAPC